MLCTYCYHTLFCFWFSLHLFSFRFSFEILFVHYSRIMVQSLAWFFFSLHGDTCTFILKLCFALFNKMGYYVINNVDSAWICSFHPFLFLSLCLCFLLLTVLIISCYSPPSYSPAISLLSNYPTLCQLR